MKPVTLKDFNIVYAKDQPEYLPLPASVDVNGLVKTCWQASLKERFQFLLSGKIKVNILTFNKPLQPIKVEII